MALKPTIYKFNITLSDLNRDYYDTLNLTVAQHPSETVERMMVRVMVYCLNVHELLAFTKGLSEPEQPDLWLKTLDGQLALWIDVGEPGFDRIKKATRLASSVKVYSFNSKSDVWWQKSRDKFAQLDASIYQFKWEQIQTLATWVQRTMDCSITISDSSVFFASDTGDCELSWLALQEIG